jgi:periplasmic protein TonB
MTVVSDFDFDIDERPPSRRLWVLAGMVALSLHLGGAALAIVHLASNQDDDGLGANTDEFAVEMVSPKVMDDNLPPGPDTDAAQASQQQVEQKAELKETNLPQDKPTETDDPDRVVSPNKSEKTKEDPKVATVQTEAAPEQQASEATSRQTLDPDAPNADMAKAPNPHGLGKDKLKLTGEWGKKISATIKLHQRYPPSRTGPATVKVAIMLNRRGNVLGANVLQSSGDTEFDEAALSMIHRSDPMPLPPAGLTDDQYNFSLDVNFPKRQ